jgi:glucan phosphoethanolaminetransferase (alkaline phosphatase superfamily)
MGKFYSISRGKIVKSYARCREGEEGLRILLLYWCTVPAAIYIFVRFKVRLYAFLEWPVDLFIVILSVLDVFFIQKALKKHPEYDSEFVRNREKEKYYASLSGEELEKVKSSEKKENAKNFAKRLFLLDRSKRIDAYKIVRLFVLLTMLVALRRFLM